jgi:poly-beta-1,6-N-acetyl-D-glucosamine synthase
MQVFFDLLFWGWVGVTAVQVVVWVVFPTRLLRYVRRVPSATQVAHHGGALPPVSVVVCARNEADNLRTNLPTWLSQDYPAGFEVLVVDDDSSDETMAVLTAARLKNSKLNSIRIEKKQHAGKKYALAQGIATAQYAWLVLTDADCRPASTYWLQHLMSATERPATEVILGYAPMRPAKGFWSRWTRFETAYVALQYLSMASVGWPYMGVGRNLAWHRRTYVAAGGFERHTHLASGDDDLLVNAVAHRHNTTLCIAPAAFVHSAAKNTVNSWFFQKKRHLSAGLVYTLWHRLLLGGVAFTHSVHYGLGLILWLAQPDLWPFLLAGYTLRLLVVWLQYTRGLTLLGERDLVPSVPLLDGLLAVWLGAGAPLLLLLGNREGRW